VLHLRTRLPLLALALAVAIAPAAEAQGKKKKRKLPNVTAMSRNIYLGGDIFRPIGAIDKADFERRTGELWQIVQDTNFPVRARLIAKEIKRTKPDFIGMQEVALWRRGPKDDPAPATQVVYDFEKILRRALKRERLDYVLGARKAEADIEGPVSQGFDVRLTMYDVILVKKRRGLRVTRRDTGGYEADIGVPTPVGTLTSRRGWASVDATVDGRRLRFVTTHLESVNVAEVRERQAVELVGADGPLRTRRPTILVGDMNSDPASRGGAPQAAYDTITGFGMRDSWGTLYPSRDGLTFGFSETLTDVNTAAFDKRIDYVFSRGRKLTPLNSQIVGIQQGNRGPAPLRLWPADHAGVVTKYRLR
jgi:endonuclease/exonuclease/phosphatase family protein